MRVCRHSCPLGPGGDVAVDERAVPRLLARDHAGRSRSAAGSRRGRRACLKLSDARSSDGRRERVQHRDALREEAGQQHVADHQQLHVVGVAGEREAAVPVLRCGRCRAGCGRRRRADPRRARAGERERAVGRGVVDHHDAQLRRPPATSTESRQRSSVASALRTGMHTATRARRSSPKTVTASPSTAELAQLARDRRLEGVRSRRVYRPRRALL